MVQKGSLELQASPLLLYAGQILITQGNKSALEANKETRLIHSMEDTHLTLDKVRNRGIPSLTESSTFSAADHRKNLIRMRTRNHLE